MSLEATKVYSILHNYLHMIHYLMTFNSTSRVDLTISHKLLEKKNCVVYQIEVNFALLILPFTHVGMLVV